LDDPPCDGARSGGRGKGGGRFISTVFELLSLSRLFLPFFVRCSWNEEEEDVMEKKKTSSPWKKIFNGKNNSFRFFLFGGWWVV